MDCVFIVERLVILLLMSGKSPSLSTDQRLLTGGVSLEKSSSATLLLVRLQWANKFHNCQALLDSGAEGNFIDASLPLQLDIPVVKLPHSMSVQALGGQVMPSKYWCHQVHHLR